MGLRSTLEAGWSGPLASAYGFAVFNGLSSQVVLGSPLILYGKSLGASATVLGILAGMMPLLVILQMPSAQYLPRVGYKRFMSAGWSARVLFIFVLALVPLCPGFLDATTRLSLVLALMFLFNLLRGISSCAWLPWVMELVSVESRGKYLIREQLCVNLAGAVAFALAAMVLGSAGTEWRYSVVFAFSALTGVGSLKFLGKIPDMPVPEEERVLRGPVPWMELASFPPFRKVLQVSLAWAIAYGGLLTFIAAYLRSEAGLSDGVILFAMTAFFSGGTASGWVAARRLDRLGSRPVLRMTMLIGGLLAFGWWLQAGKLLGVHLWLVLLLLLVLGLANALFNAAAGRLAMLSIPKMGRSHFLALYSVTLNTGLGLAPVAWGLVIDAIGRREGLLLHVEWNRFSVFFSLVAVAFGISFWVAGRLEESAASRVETLLRELLVHEPRKVLNRLWSR